MAFNHKLIQQIKQAAAKFADAKLPPVNTAVGPPQLDNRGEVPLEDTPLHRMLKQLRDETEPPAAPRPAPIPRDENQPTNMWRNGLIKPVAAKPPLRSAAMPTRLNQIYKDMQSDQPATRTSAVDEASGLSETDSSAMAHIMDTGDTSESYQGRIASPSGYKWPTYQTASYQGQIPTSDEYRRVDRNDPNRPEDPVNIYPKPVYQPTNRPYLPPTPPTPDMSRMREELFGPRTQDGLLHGGRAGRRFPHTAPYYAPKVKYDPNWDINDPRRGGRHGP